MVMHQIAKKNFAVVVPVEAKIVVSLTKKIYATFNNKNSQKICEADYKLIGEITHDSISFYCEPYVEKHHYYPSYFKHYQDAEDFYKYAKGSFRSLLQSKGLYWEDKLDYGALVRDIPGQSAEASKLTKEQKLILIEKK